jgi:hypothetical protein
MPNLIIMHIDTNKEFKFIKWIWTIIFVTPVLVTEAIGKQIKKGQLKPLFYFSIFLTNEVSVKI